MAPKTKEQKALEKKKEAEKQKVAEDKTFGLKNKNKSKAVQRHIKQITGGRVQVGGDPAAAEKAKKEEAKKDAQRNALLNSLFNMATDKKGRAYDPKSKGKAKAKSEKIDLYTDQRDQMGKDEEEKKMEWTQEELEKVVKTKHGAQQTTTDIICKHFLDAVEKRIYGWFWVCPNGGDKCKYRHSLPPGYVLKRDLPKPGEEEEEDDTPFEEVIEEQRAALPAGGTPVTLERFKEWKAKKEEERRAKVEEERKKAAEKTGGRGLNVMSGRDLFHFDASLFVDDDGAWDNSGYGGGQEDEPQEEAQAAEARKPEAESAEGSGQQNGVEIDAAVFAGEEDLPDDDDLDDDE